MTIGQQAASTACPCVSPVSARPGVLKHLEHSKAPSLPNCNEMQPLLQEARLMREPLGEAMHPDKAHSSITYCREGM